MTAPVPSARLKLSPATGLRWRREWLDTRAIEPDPRGRPPEVASRLRIERFSLGWRSCPALFVQVNTGEEPQKAGVLPADVDAFVAECRSLDLPLRGLMCIPPADEEPALHFALLAKMADRNGLSGLSMGMSGDFETAIALGATHIRVGAAIFGARVPNPT